MAAIVLTPQQPPQQVQLKPGADKLYVRMPGHESYLAHIRAIITDLARQVGFTEQEVAKIEMAVDEACTNVVEHAYDRSCEWTWKRPDPQIRLQVRVENHQLIIEIIDHGQRFDFSAYQPASIQENLGQMRHGGYGIAIIRQFMDAVQYRSSNNAGNMLRMVKHLKKS